MNLSVNSIFIINSTGDNSKHRDIGAQHSECLLLFHEALIFKVSSKQKVHPYWMDFLFITI